MGFRILIADDEALVLKDLGELLEEMGYQVVSKARDGDEALRQYKKTKPDICIFDIEMPGKTGLQAAREISAQCPVILLTAYSEPEMIREAKQIGVMAYLTKPFRQNEISPAIELAVSQFLKISDLTDQMNKLKTQLEARKVVEKAKGLMMEKKNMSETEAYQHIQKLSMKKNVSMKRVAEAIVLAMDTSVEHVAR
jgi:two-component system, response regulator PdtaR